MTFRWELFDELVKAVESKLPDAEIHGTSVRDIVTLTLSLAFLMMIYADDVQS